MKSKDLTKMSDKKLLQLIVCNPEVHEEIMFRIERGNASTNIIRKMFGQDKKLDKFILELEEKELERKDNV